MKKIFLQIGAGRDGLDPYFNFAKECGFDCVLIESHDYLSFRQQQGFTSFDLEIGVNNPTDKEDILSILVQQNIKNIQLVLAGFEISNTCAFQVANTLNCSPFDGKNSFIPLHKGQQRLKITQADIAVMQPFYHFCEDLKQVSSLEDKVRFPLIVKPVDAGGGLGVNFIENKKEWHAAIERLASMNNYGGVKFSGFIVEGYIEGDEISLQGICHQGKAKLLSSCRKIILPDIDSLGTKGFRESGHIAQSEINGDTGFMLLAQQLCELFGYQRGAFHIDLILSNNDIYFIEMGFRLSGMGVEKITGQVIGHSWSKLAFMSAINVILPIVEPKDDVAVGRLTIRNRDILQNAIKLKLKTPGFELTFPSKPSDTPSFSKNLYSDNMRHGGVIGIVEMHSDSIQRIYIAFTSCIQSYDTQVNNSLTITINKANLCAE